MHWQSSILLFLFFQATAHAQSTAGVTGIRDTSYSNQSAYNSIKKNHPEARLVPELKSPAVKEVRNISYCKQGERRLQLDAFCPTTKTKTKRAAILIIHGGGWRSGSRTQHHALAQRLATIGYVCFTPEYRLSTEALYPAAVYDLKAALRWVHKNAKKYNVDTTKIAVLGFSAGGQLAALLGTTMHSPKFEGAVCHTDYTSNAQAIIDLDGTLSFVHPESGEGDDSKKTSAATYWFGYQKKENTGVWEEASPLSHVSQLTPPTLFINSSVDRMHAGRDDFRKVLEKYNIYSEVKTFEGAPHHFPFFDPWFEPMVQYIDGFLGKVFFGKRNKA
jgi:pectinesterase